VAFKHQHLNKNIPDTQNFPDIFTFCGFGRKLNKNHIWSVALLWSINKNND